MLRLLKMIDHDNTEADNNNSNTSCTTMLASATSRKIES
jgi:hypothetical protein